ncbi:MAG: PilN domain-containing protein [Phycisphaeraceae bacterium]|nr:PilN domain-containing protein [Phycisphaeraceae bacterium]
MTSPTPIKPSPSARPGERVAVLHRQGAAWRILIASIAPAAPSSSSGGGHAESGGVEVLAVRSVDDASARALDAVLREHRVTRLLRILPAASTVCRAVSLPDSAAGPAESAAALALVAEADLPSSIPSWRRAGGLVQPIANGTPPLALLIGWPDSSPAPASLPLTADFESESWIPEPVALACFARQAAAQPDRVVESAVYADPSAGSAIIVAASLTRSVARILRADTSTRDGFAAAVRAAVDETRKAIALPPAPIDVTGPEPSVALSGTRGASPVHQAAITGLADPSLKTTHAIALGAAIAWASRDPALVPLLSLSESAPDKSASPLLAAITWLSDSRRAAIVIAASLAVLLFWPLAVAATRSAVVLGRAGGQDALRERLDHADTQAAFYELLRSRRWPMTKLLADVAGAAPVGLRLESIELNPEQSGNAGLSLRGHADNREVIAAFRKNLTDLRIFDDVSFSTSASNAPESTGDDFRLQARVAGPLMRVNPSHDYAQESLAALMYGADAAASSTRYERRTDRDSRSAEPSSSRTTRRQPRASAPPAEAPRGIDIPPPLTDDEIAAFDSKAAGDEMRKRAAAANAAGLDEATKQRLKDEVDKCKKRMLAALTEKKP